MRKANHMGTKRMKQTAATFVGYGIYNRESGSWIKDCIPTGLGGVDYQRTFFLEDALDYRTFENAERESESVCKELGSPFWGPAQIHLKD